MRILSCYIENYGNISQKSYDFNGPIYSICEKNGTGKSTLASFIRAMFYGLKSYTARSRDFCEREHFFPFNAGKFGGFLIFNWNDATYKIERFFDKKSDREDTLKVYKNNSITTEFGNKIGEIVFGVDQESFSRTIFIDSDEIEIKSTSSINAKLGAFLLGTTDDDDVDNALKILLNTSKQYKKSQGGQDYISQQKNKIQALRDKIDNASAISIALIDKRKEYASLLALEKEYKKDLVLAQQQSVRKEQLERYNGFLNEICAKEKEINNTLAKYVNGLPTREDVSKYSSLLSQKNTIESRSSVEQFSTEEVTQYEKLNSQFAIGIPSFLEIEHIEKNIRDYSTLRTKIDEKKQKSFSEDELALRHKFANISISGKQLENCETQINEYKETRDTLASTPSFVTPESTATKKLSPKNYIFIATLAIVLLLIGGIFSATSFFTLGIILIIIGALTLMIDAFLYLNKKTSFSQSSNQTNPEYERLKSKLRHIEQAIYSFISCYGYHSDNGVLSDYETFKKDYEKYGVLEKQYRDNETELSELSQKATKIKETIDKFFNSYQLFDDNYISMLSFLQSNISAFSSLKKRKVVVDKTNKINKSNIEEIEKALENLKRKYGIVEFDIEKIINDINLYENNIVAIRELKTKALKFKEEKNLNTSEIFVDIDIEQIQNNLNNTLKKLSQLKKEIEDDETEIENLDYLLSQLDEEDDLLKKYQHKHKLLVLTKDILIDAIKSLNEKYVKPVKDKFLSFATIIEKTIGEKIVMSKDFEIRFERNGEERSDKHLSAGQKSICAFCFRLALIKNMYKNNHPFLILDDPFTTLDEEHMEKIRTVISSLTSDFQILYFTCHESRKI